MSGCHLVPPLPTEHGATSVLVVGLLTPVSLAIAAGVNWTISVLGSYLLFVTLAVGTMLYRAAVRRYRLADGPRKRYYATYGAVEGTVVVLAIAGLVALQGPEWGVALVALPGVVAELRYRGQGSSVPLLDVVMGVLGLSVLVPAGALIVGIEARSAVASLFVLFAAYHVLATYRVKTVMKRSRERSDTSTTRWLMPFVVVLLVVVAGWSLDVLGVAAPILFLVSTVRTGKLAAASESPSTKRLGRSEAFLSLLFVLGAPWLLP
ncbi:MAG: hypothetical protein ACI9PP_002253 [Halobacteriales archaeon]|jgi:hypothetical protein